MNRLFLSQSTSALLWEAFLYYFTPHLVIVNSNTCSPGYSQVYANFNLKVGSFNIHGQGNKNQVKLRKIKNLFTKGGFDIFLLQETRSDGSEKELKKWQKIFNTKQIFLTNFGTNAVGAGIVVKSDQDFTVHRYFWNSPSVSKWNNDKMGPSEPGHQRNI